LIEFQGGKCHLVADPTAVVGRAWQLASDLGGHFMDQFTYAERATDWRGNNNIAESIFEQLAHERHPIPAWIVVGAGTGGTSATIGRYVRYQRHATRLLVVDPENSSFYPSFEAGTEVATGLPSRIEGIGRPRVEPSFVPSVIDQMLAVPDAASIAAARWCTTLTGRSVGGSTGTALWGALRQIAIMRRDRRPGSVVTLLCDGGERYARTYYDDRWLADHGIDIAPYTETLEKFSATGEWLEPAL
ncbi:MAG TPA: pyridoxal-phosphate dependent enzyme, partial [Kribbellaceae bacterium]|nr:pyridoxal-phosphate dependent enzyme [Kribbellaceae bacterium]